MKDVREHALLTKRLSISIEMDLVCEGEAKGLVGNLGDELSEMLTKRIENTVGVSHLATTEWDLSLQ